MNIEMIKEKVSDCKGEKMKFRFLGSRNQVEEFTGKIIKTYHCVFLVESEHDNRIKSFSYSDVLMDHLQFHRDL